MLTQKKPAEAAPEVPATKSRARAGARPDSGNVVCWFEDAWVPLADAKVGIMTHSFLYGTAVFEGIRAYWNADQGQLYLLKLREHFERITDSGKIMMMDPGYTVQELMDLAVELVRRNGFREDAYVRPTLYKSSEAIGVRLHNVDCKINILAIPFGDYIDTNAGINCGTVSWRRTSDLAIPSRAKIVGSYVNPAFSKTEAMLNGYDEAIVLTHDGKVAEGSAENLFLVRRGQLDHAGRGLGHPGGHHPGRHHRPREAGTGPRYHPSIGRSYRVVPCGRGVPVRHGRPDLVGYVDRPSAGWRRAGGTGLNRHQPRLLRCRTGPEPGLR